MNRKQKELLCEIIDLIIDRQQIMKKEIIKLKNEVKLLNTRINVLKNRQLKGCFKCSK